VYLAVRPGPAPSKDALMAGTDPGTSAGSGSAASAGSQPPGPPTIPPPTQPATAGGGSAATTDSPDPKTTDAKTTDAKTTDPNVQDPKPGKPPRQDPRKPGRREPGSIPPPPDEDDGDEPDGGDDDIRQKLRDATAALDAKDHDRAERLATSVINSPASRRQHASARLIRGTVQCLARNDQEAAGIDLRGLAGFPKMRARLLGICRQRGVLSGP
jgi:hypothetical protein